MTDIVERTNFETSPATIIPRDVLLRKLKESEVIKSKFQRELTVDERTLIANDEAFNDIEESAMQWTWDVCLDYFAKENADNFKLKDLENYSNQTTALLAIKLAPTIKNRITKTNDVSIVIKWAQYLNLENNHIQSDELDELLEKSAGIILENKKNMLQIISKNKPTDDLKDILDIVSKNCSQRVLDTFHEILNKTSKSNLKDEEKKIIYDDCLKSLRKAVHFSLENEIYTPFIFGKYQLFSLVEEIGGGNLTNLDEANLDSMIDNLFKIYFNITGNFNLSDFDKSEIFENLVPYDNSNKKEYVINKISEVVGQQGYDSEKFSKQFATNMLEKILTVEANDKNTKVKTKCAEILIELYLSDTKNNELKRYIRDSFKTDQPDVNEILLDSLLKKYAEENIDETTKSDIYDLTTSIYDNHFDTIKHFDCFAKCLDTFIEKQDDIDSASDARNYLEKFLKSTIDNREKKKFLDSLEEKGHYEKFSAQKKKNILEVFSNVLNTADDELVEELLDTITNKFIEYEIDAYGSDKISESKELKISINISTLNKWFRIILSSENGKDEYENILKMMKKEITSNKMPTSQKKECYAVVGDSFSSDKDKKKKFLDFSIDLLKELIK